MGYRITDGKKPPKKEESIVPKKRQEKEVTLSEREETVVIDPKKARDDTEPLKPLKDKKRKKKRRPVLMLLRVVFTLFLLSGLGVVAAVVSLPDLNSDDITKDLDELGVVSVEDTNLQSDELQSYTEKRENTMNILIIGVDGYGYDATRSDVMMVMSMNRETKSVHLVSMQRDTMAYLPVVDRYEKLNHSFAYGGGLATLQAINTNYDLDMEEYVAFDFEALETLIDRIGGVEVDVSEAEAYGAGLDGTGMMKLSGEEALRYVRIRSTAGGDAGRNERQREVLMYVFRYATQMGVTDLVGTAQEMMPLVKTSYEYGDILPMARFYDTFRGETEFITEGFPMDQTFASVDGLSYVIPMTAESNTISLHKLLFNYENYKPSDRVIEHSRRVGEKSGQY